MIEEKYPGHEEANTAVQAKVILAKCPYTTRKSENVFGMRIQKCGTDWTRTWAFKIDMEKAHNEGYDKEVTSGTYRPDAGYPGCPYCGNSSWWQCGSCGCIVCMDVNSQETYVKCPRCGNGGYLESADEFTFNGGAM